MKIQYLQNVIGGALANDKEVKVIVQSIDLLDSTVVEIETIEWIDGVLYLGITSPV